jgi:hypothetical protein
VTDAGLSQLHGLKKLKRLYVWQSGVTQAGIDALKQALPECKVTAEVKLTPVEPPKEEKKEEPKAEEKQPEEKKPEEKKEEEKKPEEKKDEKPAEEKKDEKPAEKKD